MGLAAKQLQSARAARNLARSAFDRRLAQVRDDLDARGVGSRIADRVGDGARDIYDEALDIAGHNRGVIAGTIAALAIWFLRNPIVAGIEALVGKIKDAGDD